MTTLTDKLRARLAPALGDDEYAIALTEKLLAAVEALERTRGQWIHSVNAPECLKALAALEEMVGGE